MGYYGNKNMKRFLVLISVLLFSAPVFSEDDLSKTIKQFEKTLESIEDFEADFEQTQINVLLDRKKKSTGKIYSLPKGRVFWHTQEPKPLKVVSNGKWVWLYHPDNGQVFKEKWESMNRQTKVALLFLRREGNLTKHFNIKWKDKKKLAMELRPKGSLGVEKVWLYLSRIGKQKLFFKKIVFFFPLDRKTELTFKNVKFDQKLLKKHLNSPIDKDIDERFHLKLRKKSAK